MSVTDTDYQNSTGATPRRDMANGASSTLSAEAAHNVERFDEARRQLKERASEIRKVAGERLERARTKAAALAHTAGEKATEAGKGAVTHVRAHPVRSAVIAAGAVGAAVAVAMLVRNNRSRHIAAKTAKHFWSDYGKILMPLAAALAVPAKAAADEAPKLAHRGSKLLSRLPNRLSGLPDRLSRALH